MPCGQMLALRATLIVLLLSPLLVHSHSGGLDNNGGHTNRKTNEYHCHRSPCKAQSGKLKSTLTSSRYNRKDWPHWVDADSDCQNTRAEILIRDSLVPVKFKRNKGCNVSHGKWVGPYTGKVMTKASDLDIDHIVPLSHAHKTGGASWSRSKKRQFANDPLNLLAVDDATNQAKSDKSPKQWKPPLNSYWCTYAARWKMVKAKYGLSVGGSERRAMGVMDRRCD